ncbi:MAG TPA: hypothetical protein VG841_10715 [Caulobacterales bacterium]|nr:hypothetical protein [Caulobacterales bacterium]
MQPRTLLPSALLLALGLALTSPAAAEEARSPQTDPAGAQGADEGAVLSAEDLEALAGGDGVDVNVITDQTLTAINSGNTVSGQTVTSGQINMTDGAFANFNGVGNFVMNTGHNNNLQSNLNVDVVLAR